MKTLLLSDSSIYIRILRMRGSPFRFFGNHSTHYEFATCGMVMMEVLRGLREPAAVEYARGQFGRLTYLPTHESTWDLARSLAWQLERAGLRIPVQDIIIAACAKEAGATVFTHDGDFRRIPGVKVISSIS